MSQSIQGITTFGVFLLNKHGRNGIKRRVVLVRTDGILFVQATDEATQHDVYTKGTLPAPDAPLPSSNYYQGMELKRHVPLGKIATLDIRTQGLEVRIRVLGEQDILVSDTDAPYVMTFVLAVDQAVRATGVFVKASRKLTATFEPQDVTLQKDLATYRTIGDKIASRMRVVRRGVGSGALAHGKPFTLRDWAESTAPMPPLVNVAAAANEAVARSLDNHAILLMGNVYLHRPDYEPAPANPNDRAKLRVIAFSLHQFFILDPTSGDIKYKASLFSMRRLECVAGDAASPAAPEGTVERVLQQERLRLVLDDKQVPDITFSFQRDGDQLPTSHVSHNVRAVAQVLATLAEMQGYPIDVVMLDKKATPTQPSTSAPAAAARLPPLQLAATQQQQPQQPQPQPSEFGMYQTPKALTPRSNAAAAGTDGADHVQPVLSPLGTPRVGDASPRDQYDGFVGADAGSPRTPRNAASPTPTLRSMPSFSKGPEADAVMRAAMEGSLVMSTSSSFRLVPSHADAALLNNELSGIAAPVPVRLSRNIPDLRAPSEDVKKFHTRTTLLARRVLRLTARLTWEARILIVTDVGRVLLMAEDVTVRRNIPLRRIRECIVTHHKEGTALTLMVKDEHDCVLRLAPNVPESQRMEDVAMLLKELNPDMAVRRENGDSSVALKVAVSRGRDLKKPEGFDPTGGAHLQHLVSRPAAYTPIGPSVTPSTTRGAPQPLPEVRRMLPLEEPLALALESQPTEDPRPLPDTSAQRAMAVPHISSARFISPSGAQVEAEDERFVTSPLTTPRAAVAIAPAPATVPTVPVPVASVAPMADTAVAAARGGAHGQVSTTSRALPPTEGATASGAAASSSAAYAELQRDGALVRASPPPPPQYPVHFSSVAPLAALVAPADPRRGVERALQCRALLRPPGVALHDVALQQLATPARNVRDEASAPYVAASIHEHPPAPSACIFLLDSAKPFDVAERARLDPEVQRLDAEEERECRVACVCSSLGAVVDVPLRRFVQWFVPAMVPQSLAVRDNLFEWEYVVTSPLDPAATQRALIESWGRQARRAQSFARTAATLTT